MVKGVLGFLTDYIRQTSIFQASWWKAIARIIPVRTLSKAVMVWMMGDHATELAACSDDLFIQVILTLIEHYTTIKPPKPSKVLR